MLRIKKDKCNSKKHYSDKNVLYNDINQKSEIEINSQKLSGIFTKININDISISNITGDIKRKKEKEIIIEQNLPKTYDKKENINNFSNLKRNVKTKNSTNYKS